MGVEVNALMSICTYCYIKIVILSTISVQGRIEQLMVLWYPPFSHDPFILPAVPCRLHFFFSLKKSQARFF